MRTELDRLLERLHEALVGQACLALEALADAASMVDGSGSADRLGATTDLEARLTERCREIEHDIEVLLARHAPVACGLRCVLALLRINHHRERVGHHAVRMACSTLEPDAVPDTARTTALLAV